MPPQHEPAADTKALLKELEQHNAFFDDLVDMIPAKLYVAGNSGDSMYNPKYRKGQHKESKEARRARNKIAKRNKFDPETSETTRQEKIRLEKEEVDDAFSASDDDDDMDEDGEQMEDAHEEENDMKEQKHDNNKNKSTTSALNLTPNQSRIEELRAKLRAKLEEKRSHRPGSNGNSDTMVSKRAARRVEKQRRIELAKKRQLSGSKGTTQTGKTKMEKISIVQDLGGTKISKTGSATTTTVGDDLSGIDFGGITGLKNDLAGNYTEANKSLKNQGKKKSLERLLAEAEAKKERLRQLKESDIVEDKEKAKNIVWGDTLKAASGASMKEANTTLLKKAIKRKAKKKAKSQKAWESRTEQTQEKMDERQRIRTHNVKQRIKGGATGANLSKKRIKDDAGGANDEGGDNNDKDKKKRPRLGPYGKDRAGFEGKKSDFINKGGDDKKNVKGQ